MGLTLLQAFGMFLPLWFEGALGLYANAVILGLTFVGMVSMTLTIIKNINPVYSNLFRACDTGLCAWAVHRAISDGGAGRAGRQL